MMRTLMIGLLCCAAAASVSCGGQAPAPIETRPALSSALDSPEQAAIAAAYAERLRLGLGSPFRLVDLVLHDERIADRQSIALALLQRVRAGELYSIDARVLMVSPHVAQSSAIAQLELIQDAVRRAPDPRIGEAAVDSAYAMLEREGTVSSALTARAVRVAALTRDAELARRDALSLHATAQRDGWKETDLLQRWRRARVFAVEQPTLLPLDEASAKQAREFALLLLGGVRTALAAQQTNISRTISADTSLLSDAQAQLLLALAKVHDTPPQDALIITLRALKSGLTAKNEEELVARSALRAMGTTSSNELFECAVALRPFAQESFDTDSIDARTLSNRYGVRLRFQAGIPAAARRKTLHDVANALTDLRDALPTIDLRGLQIEIRHIPRGARFQAFHDPKSRLVRLDPEAAAGMLAHEIGHDLDWQLALRKYGVTGRYATDIAAHRRGVLRSYVPSLSDDGERPTEAFARRFEWYVVSALAAQGRSNGYLSSLQTEQINGYGWAVKPSAAPMQAYSFTTILSEAAWLDRAQASTVFQSVRAQSVAPLVQSLISRSGRENGELKLGR